MQAQPTSMSDILSGPKQYVIPVFQRYYEWEEERWKNLWQDIIALVDEHDNNVTHFIGPMVIIARAVPYAVPRYLVIDGQQRLMTIFILLSAIRDHARNLTLKTIADSINSNSLAFLNTDGNQIPKIVPRIRDQKTLLSIFEAKYSEIDTDSLLAKAYTYFLEEIEQLTPRQPGLFDKTLDPRSLLERLYQVIIQRLRIVMISLDNNDNPSNIYESLNFKRDNLLDADLIRNYIFMQLKTIEEQESFNSTVWKPFEEFFEIENQQTKNYLTDFYYKYLITKTEYLARNRLYAMFTIYVDNFLKQKTLQQLVNELKQYAHYYISITHYCDDPDLEISFQRFRQLDTDTAIPLILDLYFRYESRTGEGKITKSVFLTMLQLIESFILRRSILRDRTRGYGLDFAVAQQNSQNLQSLMDYFAQKGWPTDEQIKQALQAFELYHRESKKCALILKEIELSYGHKEKIDLGTGAIQIEHIMPQNLTLQWREMLGVDADSIHEKYLHTLGNLTLTGYNVDLSDRPYAYKKEVYKESNFQLNAYFADHENWTEQEIVTRTDYLARKFVEIWPRPNDVTGLLKKPIKRNRKNKSDSTQSELL